MCFFSDLRDEIRFSLGTPYNYNSDGWESNLKNLELGNEVFFYFLKFGALDVYDRLVNN